MNKLRGQKKDATRVLRVMRAEEPVHLPVKDLSQSKEMRKSK